MAGVSYQLARTAIIDPLTAALAVATLVLLWKTGLNWLNPRAGALLWGLPLIC
jgi:hypothetical protein